MATIQIADELIEKLNKMRINDEDTYEDIIWDLVEDSLELSEETKRNIEEARRDIEKGDLSKFSKLEDIKKKMKL
jgi:predicted CopG family antitoxin